MHPTLLPTIMLLGLSACTESGESPTTCDPDLELDGASGATITESVEVVAGTPQVRCLFLDTRGARGDVGLQVDGGFESTLHFGLSTPARTLLAQGDGRLQFELPADQKAFVVLTISVTPPVSSSGGLVALAFSDQLAQ